jgi:hypothetical protein
MDDLRRVPRPFCVLREGANHLDDAIRMWLSKFPCMADLSEIGPDTQEDIRKWTHVACALSRISPSRIWKAKIKKHRELTDAEIE